MATPRKRSASRDRRDQLKQIRLGQNLFRSRSIAQQIIRTIDFQKHQVVLELAAGEGFFTGLIAPHVRSLTATDIDPSMIRALRTKFSETRNVRIVRQNVATSDSFGNYDVIFGSIPFNKTAVVFRKLIHPDSKFGSCHLVIQQESAHRILPSDRSTTMAVLAYPFLEISTGMPIPKWAYKPQPAVETAVVHVHRRHKSLIDRIHHAEFKRFVKIAMKSGTRKLSRSVGSNLSYRNWRQVCSESGLSLNSTHLDLSPEKYVALFNALTSARRRS